MPVAGRRWIVGHHDHPSVLRRRQPELNNTAPDLVSKFPVGLSAKTTMAGLPAPWPPLPAVAAHRTTATDGDPTDGIEQLGQVTHPFRVGRPSGQCHRQFNVFPAYNVGSPSPGTRSRSVLARPGAGGAGAGGAARGVGGRLRRGGRAASAVRPPRRRPGGDAGDAPPVRQRPGRAGRHAGAGRDGQRPAAAAVAVHPAGPAARHTARGGRGWVEDPSNADPASPARPAAVARGAIRTALARRRAKPSRPPSCMAKRGRGGSARRPRCWPAAYAWRRKALPSCPRGKCRRTRWRR